MAPEVKVNTFVFQLKLFQQSSDCVIMQWQKPTNGQNKSLPMWLVLKHNSAVSGDLSAAKGRKAELTVKNQLLFCFFKMSEVRTYCTATVDPALNLDLIL